MVNSDKQIRPELAVGRAAYEDARFQSFKEEQTWLLDIVSKDESSFDIFFAVVIVLNLIVIGVETDYGEEHQSTFRSIEIGFLVCFTVEFVLRVQLHRKFCDKDEKDQAQDLKPTLVCEGGVCRWVSPAEANAENTNHNENECHPGMTHTSTGISKKIQSIKDILADTLNRTEQKIESSLYTSKNFRLAWLAFDFILILSSTIGLISAVIRENGLDEGQGAQLILLRIVRILRIVRSVKLVRYFKSLILLLHALKRGMETIFWVGFLLTVVVFICAVFLCRILGKDDQFRHEVPDVHERFKTIGDTMFTLFQIITLENWTDICLPSMKYDPGWAIFFITFIIFTNFTILNLFVAILVEHVMQLATKSDIELMQKMEQEQRESSRKLRLVFSQADIDGDHILNVNEFRTMMELPEVKVMLKDMGVETDISWLFDILDIDKSGFLQVDEFLDGIMTTRSSEMSRQLMRIQYTIIGEIRRNQKGSLDSLRDAASCLCDGLPASPDGSTNVLGAQPPQGPKSEIDNLAKRMSNVEEELRSSRVEVGNRLAVLEEQLSRSHAEVLAAIKAVQTGSVPSPPALLETPPLPPSVVPPSP